MKVVTVMEATEKFLRKKKIERIVPKAIENYKYNLTTFQEFYSGKLCDLNQDHVDDYILYLQEETDLSLTTVNNKIRDLRAFLRFCKRQGITTQDYEIKLIRVNEPEIIPFDDYQLKQLYDACLKVDNPTNYAGKGLCHYRDYVLMRMLEETGMRIGEALRLDIPDVDLKRNLIHIRLSKNKKARVTYFTQALHEEIKKYLEVRQDFLYDKNLAATSFFITRDGKRLCIPTVQDKLRDYGQLAGIKNVRCSPHTFRHTFARNYLINGGDVFTLKDILGHSSLDMTYRYTRLFGTEKQNQYNKVMEKYSKSKKNTDK